MIPRSLLPHRVDVSPRTGLATEGGSTYGPAKTVACRLQSTTRKIRTGDGASTVLVATAIITGTDIESVPVDARVTIVRGPRNLGTSSAMRVADVSVLTGGHGDEGATAMLAEGAR